MSHAGHRDPLTFHYGSMIHPCLQHHPSVTTVWLLNPVWLSPLRHWNITQVLFKNTAGAGVRCFAVVVACHYSPSLRSQLRNHLACLCTILELMGLTTLSTPVAARAIQPTKTTPVLPLCGRFTHAVEDTRALEHTTCLIHGITTRWVPSGRQFTCLLQLNTEFVLVLLTVPYLPRSTVEAGRTLTLALSERGNEGARVITVAPNSLWRFNHEPRG